MAYRNSLLCILGMLLVTVGIVRADPITDLYDTGVDKNGVSLPLGTSPDSHYRIISRGDGSKSDSTVLYHDFLWLPNTSSSAWIAPYPASVYPNGPFDYQTTFTLPANAISVTISANLASDDFGSDILLNGQSVGAPSFNGYTSYTPISFTSENVLSGTNTLTFDTVNAFTGTVNTPTGLRVDSIVGNFTTDVPEPSELLILGMAAFGMLAGFRKCRTARMVFCTAIMGFALTAMSAGRVDAQYVQFSNSSDTISISGNVTPTNQATYEAILSLNSTSYPGNYVDTSGTPDHEGNVFTAWQWGREDQRLGIGDGGSVYVYSYPLTWGGFVGGNLTTGQWYDIAYVYRGGLEQIWVDGSLVSSGASGGGPIASGTSALMSVGAMFRDGGIAPSFLGDIQSLRVSNVARYSGNFYSATMSDFISDPSTLLLYDFNQIASGATSITDLSGNGHIGTFGAGFAGATSPTVFVPEPTSIGLIGFTMLLFRRRVRVA